jgi:transcriptional regulator with XRE-family HTH domain
MGNNISRTEVEYMKQTLGVRIAELRKKRKWTQEELAKKLAVSAQAVSKWENDSSMPDIDLIVKIAEIFEVSTDYLLGKKVGAVVEMANPNKKDINKLVFRINVVTQDGDKVKINLPMPLVVIALDSGLTPKIEGRDVLKDIDLKKLLELVEQGVIGKLLEVETNDGDRVEIVVE